TFAVMADINGISVLAIEEPENCIHPKLLQDYINVISQLVENCKILISSHSPFMMQYLNPKGIYIGRPNITGCAIFKPLKISKINALMRDAAGENESIGGYLFNLIAQSDDDSELLLSYLEE
ncbi:MAG: AAA family ATPase, partial [Oscillospiraceae bacterium]